MSVTVTARLRELLRDRYPPPLWSMAFEVQVERPEGGLRFLDAVAFKLAKDRVEVHGFELKVSRADWLNELQHPEKARAACGVVDFMHIVAGAPDIVKAIEVPAPLGVLAAYDEGLRVTVVPGRFNRSVETLDRALVAAFLRRLDPLEPRTYWQMQVRRAEQRGIEKGRNAKGKVTRAALKRHPEADGEELDLP